MSDIVPVLKNEVQRREVIQKKERNMNHKDTRGLVDISFYVSMPMLEKIQSFQGKSLSEKIRLLVLKGIENEASHSSSPPPAAETKQEWVKHEVTANEKKGR